MPLAAFPKCFLDHLCVAKTMSVDEWIDRAAAELDVDGLEFYWGFTPQEDAEIARIRAKLDGARAGHADDVLLAGFHAARCARRGRAKSRRRSARSK